MSALHFGTYCSTPVVHIKVFNDSKISIDLILSTLSLEQQLAVTVVNIVIVVCKMRQILVLTHLSPVVASIWWYEHADIVVRQLRSNIPCIGNANGICVTQENNCKIKELLQTAGRSLQFAGWTLQVAEEQMKPLVQFATVARDASFHFVDIVYLEIIFKWWPVEFPGEFIPFFKTREEKFNLKWIFLFKTSNVKKLNTDVSLLAVKLWNGFVVSYICLVLCLRFIET